MLQKDRLVKHKEYGLGMINNDAPIVDDVISVYFSNCHKLIKICDLIETDIKIHKCFKIDNKTFFNLHDTENYVDEKEFRKEISELFYNGCPSISCNEVVEFILEQPDKLRTILNKYKHL